VRWWWWGKEEDEWLDLILTVHDKDVFFTRSNGQKKAFPWWEKTSLSQAKRHLKEKVVVDKVGTMIIF
jgi:fatty acid-binding protein DegV